jgi:ribosomal-protein-alanine N-acetyltransferase
MSDTLHFRPMNEADLDAVLAIESLAFSHPWSRGLFADALRSYECWVMLEGDRQVGHGVIDLILDEAHLLNITVAPACQGRGLGLVLLTHLMQRARQRGGQECFLEVRASNLSAYRLYERFGFNEIGRRRNYYPAPGGGEDALVMACTLFD